MRKNEYEYVILDGMPCYYIWCFSRKGLMTGYIIIDADDLDKCKPYNWHIEKYNNRNLTYGASIYKGKVLRIHRLIMDAPSNMQVDHINHDGLDNRKINLRICNNRDNNCNKNFGTCKNASKYGTGIRKIRERYFARIMVNKKDVALGGYSTLQEAIEAREKAENYYFKEYKYAKVY